MPHASRHVRAVALSLAVAACVDPPAPSLPRDAPARDVVLAPVRRVASFTAVLSAPTAGPGMGRSEGGGAAFEVIPEGRGLGPDENPPRTVQIWSTSPFSLAAGNTGACLSGGSIVSPVSIKNFFPERFVDAYVVITASHSDHGLCAPGGLPLGTDGPTDPDAGGLLAWPGPPVHASNWGVINYATPDQYPRAALPGAPVDDGSAGGEVVSRDWRFSWPGGSSSFTVRGEIWGQPFPPAPMAAGGAGWGGFAELGETLSWRVLDREDRWQDAAVPRVDASRLWLCTAPYDAASGACGGTSLLGAAGAEVTERTTGLARVDFRAVLPAELAPGAEVWLRAVNVWTAQGTSTRVSGSFPLVEHLALVGRPALASPAAGAPVPVGGALTWTVASPAFADPVRQGVTDAIWEICEDAACASSVVSGVEGTSPAGSAGGVTTFSLGVSGGVAASLSPGVTYHWRIRNPLPGRSGAWTATRPFVYAGYPPVAMSLLSRSVPATSSAGTAAHGQDASYGGTAYGFTTAQVGTGGWLAYDLSGVPAANRQRVLVVLYFGFGNPQQQLNFRALGSGGQPGEFTADNVPLAYVLEGATAAGGPWTVLASVAQNCQPFKTHLLEFAAYTRLRVRSTAGSSPHVQMDVYAAAAGGTDGMVLYGDSIASDDFFGGEDGFTPEWFGKAIQQQHPSFFPPLVGGGIPWMTAASAVDLVVNGSGTFTTGLDQAVRLTYQAPRYAALVYGANDGDADSLTSEFQARYRTLIDSLRGQGQVVVVASPTWADDSTRQARLVRIRAAIGYHLPRWAAGAVTAGTYVWSAAQRRAYLCTTGGSSVTGPAGSGTGIADGGTARWSYVPSLREDYLGDPGVIAGPDLYAAFAGRPALFEGDGLHPNSAGHLAWRAAWVSWANATLYGPGSLVP